MKLSQLLKSSLLLLIVSSCTENSNEITYNWDTVVDRTWAGETFGQIAYKIGKSQMVN